MLPILYQDAHIVVVDKPAGLPVSPTRTSADSVETRTGWTPCHRLDEGTSGVLVLARTPAALARVNAAFAHRDVQKQYLAVVAGTPAEAFTVEVPLGDWKRGRVVIGRGRDARTRFTRRWQVGGRAGVLAEPETGRTHQIRAHLCEAGTPIVGDLDYGGPAAERLYLHAWRLVLPWPAAPSPLPLVAPPPPGFEP